MGCLSFSQFGLKYSALDTDSILNDVIPGGGCWLVAGLIEMSFPGGCSMIYDGPVASVWTLLWSLPNNCTLPPVPLGHRLTEEEVMAALPKMFISSLNCSQGDTCQKKLTVSDET